ncbi:STAS domain-containing protein [Bacillus sp. 31A1R]|uniref:STAS domain-containing protein n=1 Tax=Robertmurraya mangrovi TaxID=3098077 RepID=A0ABU5IYK7_9BACI|nr:STAS domain-containing protein [Bacillus sp. 31A1R]MDZ5472260.1 STAS domain-containing protein [Bacillus sp. 31A1R]
MSEIQELQEEVIALKEEINQYKKIIESMSVPVIPSILPETALLPITGQLLPDRLELITTKISQRVYDDEINTIIIDFSGIGKSEIGELEVLGEFISKLSHTLNLLGVEVLFVGFRPEVTNEIVKSQMNAAKELKTFLTFRAALQYLMKVKGLKLVSETEGIVE